MRKFTLTAILFISSFFSLLAAAPPTVPANNIQFPAGNLEGNRFTVSFNKGNGAFRIIVVKQGSAVSSLPVNGTEYVANAAFGTTGFEFAPGDGYVVYKGSSSNSGFSWVVTNLQPGTNYYVSIFEYNGTGVNTEYLTIPLSGNATTKTAPTGQATITSFTAVTGNKLTINFSAGTGDRRLIVARKGAAVNATPQDFTDYAYSAAFGSGAVLNTDNYVVYKGQGTSVTVTNLEPNTTYHFAIFEYNGNSYPVYLTPGNTGNRLTNAGPTQASGAINFSSIEGDRLTLSFGKGNGKYQLIVARQEQAPTFVPVNGQTYTANTAFESGQEVAPGEYVVNTVNDDRVFTHLLPATVYYFRVYDYDIDAAGNTYYLTGAYSQNSRSTAAAPTQQASNVRFENVTGSSMTIKHDAGNSEYRLVVMKEGSPVDAIPQNLTHYNGNQAYGSGNQIIPGNYVMTGGQNSTTLPVTGLTAGATYYVSVFGFNGNNYPVYAMPAATASITIPNQPTAAGTGWQTTLLQGNAMRIQWSGGNGAKRIVIARKGADVTAVPADGIDYNADPVFGNGFEIEPGQFVIYDDVNRLVDVQGLEPGAVYHFAVFEYNGSGVNNDYLVSSFLSGTGTTLTAPTDQTNGLFASNIQNTQAQINYSTGNGGGRLLIMREGAPVNAEPQDLQVYNSSTVYGVQQIGTGHYVIQKTYSSSAFTVTGLTANTTYYVSAFEFNGTTGPVYMRPGASFSFTTTGGGIPVPTVNASAPSFTAVDGNKLTFSWNEGDGAKRIVVARQGTAVTFTPVNGNDYPANASFGNGADLGSGQYVVYNGIGNTVTLTNLSPETVYHFAVFEYNGDNATATYLTAGALTANHSTAVTPAGGSSAVSGIVNNLSLNITWSSGPGDGRIVVLKEGSAVNSLPVNLSKYPASGVFGSGAQTGTGEYVVYAGSGNSVTVTGLSPNKMYHYTVFEYNGADAPVYNTANKASGSTLMPISLPLTWLYFTAVKNEDKVLLKWGTADENSTSHFVVERSNLNGNFDAIATVQAIGSGTNNYSYTDNAVPAGTVSYRIRQVDIDGHYTYSNQVVVNISQQAAVKLYPNPAPGYTRISLPQGWQQATMQLFSIEGKLVKTKTVVNGELIQLQDLPKGIYTLVINNGMNKSDARLVVQ